MCLCMYTGGVVLLLYNCVLYIVSLSVRSVAIEIIGYC